MSTDPEPPTEADELRLRIERLETRAAAMDSHVLDIRQQERRRARLGLLLALSGLAISLFLPWSYGIGEDHMPLFQQGVGPDDPFLVFTVGGVIAMLVAGCVTLAFLSRPVTVALLTAFAIVVVPALVLLFSLLPDEEDVGLGVIVAFFSAIAVPVCASRVARFPKAP